MPIEFEQLHVYALVFMALVYCLRIIWILRFRLVRDRARRRGGSLQGAAVAMTTLFRPWSMESTRKGWVQWIEFVIFHIGIAVMIGTSFVIPFAPAWLVPSGVALIVISQGLAFGAGLARLAKRLREPKLRVISSLDDYFSLAATNLLFVLCALAVLHVPLASKAYFVVIAIIIAYVPFSKISHYLYYPIARYFYGSYLGRRGILR